MGLDSEIRDPEKNLFRIRDQGQKGTGSEIRIRNTASLKPVNFWLAMLKFSYTYSQQALFRNSSRGSKCVDTFYSLKSRVYEI